MKVLAINPGHAGVHLAEREPPKLVGGDGVLVQVREVGICGTDRDEVGGGRADAPEGASELVIGHEMTGRVLSVGADVKSVRPGDPVVLMVRRPCSVCPACRGGRPDMCLSGEYTERGIKGQDGYQAEAVLDREQFVIPVPHAVGDAAVLTEPLSIAEKAIEESMSVQKARFAGVMAPESVALVAGLGPVGLLAAVALRLRGFRVIGMDVVDENNARVQILNDLGGEYVDGRKTHVADLKSRCDNIHFIFEATGVPSLEFDLMSALGVDGIYVLTGIPSGARPVNVDGATLMRGLVLGNGLMLGSVNASRHHFELAVDDLQRGAKEWPGLLDRFITDQFPPEEHDQAFAQRPDEIKTIVRWAN